MLSKKWNEKLLQHDFVSSFKGKNRRAKPSVLIASKAIQRNFKQKKCINIPQIALQPISEAVDEGESDKPQNNKVDDLEQYVHDDKKQEGYGANK